MNQQKIYRIMDYIRRQGPLPTDPYGQTLSNEDIVAWYGFAKTLTLLEQCQIKIELQAMKEIDEAIWLARLDH
jgi:hypothetical protein